jgi:hypothetical protein
MGIEETGLSILFSGESIGEQIVSVIELTAMYKRS